MRGSNDSKAMFRWLLDEHVEVLYAARDAARAAGRTEVEASDIAFGLLKAGLAVPDEKALSGIARAMNDDARSVRDNSRRRQSRKVAINWMSRPESLGYIKRVYEAAGDGPVTRKMCVGVMREVFPDQAHVGFSARDLAYVLNRYRDDLERHGL